MNNRERRNNEGAPVCRCGERLRSVPRTFMTAIAPESVLTCTACGERLMLFSAPGFSALRIWSGDIPPGMGFSEYVSQEMERHTGTGSPEEGFPCPRCAGSGTVVVKDVDKGMGGSSYTHARCGACGGAGSIRI